MLPIDYDKYKKIDYIKISEVGLFQTLAIDFSSCSAELIVKLAKFIKIYALWKTPKGRDELKSGDANYTIYEKFIAFSCTINYSTSEKVEELNKLFKPLLSNSKIKQLAKILKEIDKVYS